MAVPFNVFTSSILCVLFLAAYTDYQKNIIPNTLVLSIFIINLIFVIFFTSHHISIHLMSLFVSCVFFGTLFYLNIFGGGDAKALMAISLGLSLPEVLQMFFWISICGGLQALVFIVQKKAGAHLRNSKSIPYGIAIFGGFLWYVVVQMV